VHWPTEIWSFTFKSSN